MPDWLTNLGVGIAAAGAGAYGMYQKVMADSRNNKAADATDAAWQQVIATLREEVSRLSDRLAAVEEQNRRCEEANDALREELIAMKKQLQLFWYVDPLTLLAAANAAVAAVKKGCQLYKDIKGAAGEVKDVLDDLKSQFQKKYPNPNNAQKQQYNAEVQRVQEIGRADPNDVFLNIGNDLGALMDAYDAIGKAFIQQEAEAKEVYAGTDSIGKRALNRVIIRARLDAMIVELRETMVYKAPPELGDLWTKYEKMWKQIIVEQDDAHKRETAKIKAEALIRRRLARKRKEEAVWVGAILFVVAWYVGLLVMLRLSQTYRGLYSSPWWSCVLC